MMRKKSRLNQRQTSRRVNVFANPQALRRTAPRALLQARAVPQKRNHQRSLQRNELLGQTPLSRKRFLPTPTPKRVWLRTSRVASLQPVVADEDGAVPARTVSLQAQEQRLKAQAQLLRKSRRMVTTMSNCSPPSLTKKLLRNNQRNNQM